MKWSGLCGFKYDCGFNNSDDNDGDAISYVIVEVIFRLFLLHAVIHVLVPGKNDC